MRHYSYTSSEQPAPKRCTWDGCACEGVYPAPKARDSREYFWFCLEHVRQYNKSWDYFRGMEPEAIESFNREAIHGHRPTWKRGIDAHIYYSKKQDKILESLHDFLNITPEKPQEPVLPLKERECLAALGLAYPVTLKEIKKHYKTLVKRCHPDVTNNDRALSEQFKIISQAYQYLKKSVYFAA